MTEARGGRPQDPTIITVMKVCPEHGMTSHREHRCGSDRAGLQRFRIRCLKCHNENNSRK